MSEASLSSRSRRLPPLSPTSQGQGEGPVETTPRKKKTRSPPVDDVPNGTETHTDVTSQPKPKRKKKPVAISEEGDLPANGVKSSGELTQPVEVKKKKRKRKPQPVDESIPASEVTAALADLHEDVLALDESPRQNETQDIAVHGKTMRSQTTTKIYVEKPGGTFQRKNAERLVKTREAQERKIQKKQEYQMTTTLNIALSTHTVFMTCARYLQGLLAGLLLWHIISSYEIKKEGVYRFLDIYSNLAHPTAAMFMFLFIVICVSILDRHDIASMRKDDFIQCFTFRNGAMVILLYFFGYIITLTMYHIDDKMDTYGSNASYHWSDPERSNQDVNTWLALNVARGVFALFGFMIISARPVTDQLYTYLKTFKDPDFEIDNENYDQDESEENSDAPVTATRIKHVGAV